MKDVCECTKVTVWFLWNDDPFFRLISPAKRDNMSIHSGRKSIRTSLTSFKDDKP